jgi:hypothetical protein
MANQRGFRRFDTSRGDDARLATHEPGVEQEEVDRPPSLGEQCQRGPDTSRRVEIEFDGREDRFSGFSRELG